jgi:hypothetical protein
VPADHKWFSRLATVAVLVTALEAINPRFPAADPAVADQMARVREELAAESAWAADHPGDVADGGRGEYPRERVPAAEPTGRRNNLR